MLESQQPVQVLAGQVPPQPSSWPWHLFAQLGTQAQVPELVQVREERLQLTQLPPPTPQAALLVPLWQVPLASQQPVQVFTGQVPPQPSSWPRHFSPQ